MKAFCACLAVLLTITSCHSVQQYTSKSTASNLQVTYQTPEKWLKTQTDHMVKFTAPEQDAAVAVVYVKSADTPQQAAKQAWKEFDPTFNRQIRVNSPVELSGGWDDKREIEYVSSMAENALSLAYVHQAQNQWYVVLIDGNLATLTKRQIAAWNVKESFEVAGYQPEDLTAKSPKKLTESDIEQLLSFVQQSADALKIPGVGIAFVQDGEVLYQGGVGVKDIISNQPVDENTSFMIASNTKGMTTLLLAKLVEMGKLNWDDKVIDHYPNFKLGNTQTTESVQIKHLICACTGMPRKDLDWIFNSGPTITADVVFADLARMQPTSDFGELYQYNNQMAAAAGYVAGHVLYPDLEVGKAYDKAMQEYIFDPLLMNNTTFSMSEAMSGNYARPYALDLDGNLSLVPQTAITGFNQTVVPYRPAGAAWSTPADMIKYVQNEISQGLTKDGKQLFAAEPLLARRTPFVSAGPESSYGMGLSNVKMSGIDVIEHGGSMAGYKSNFYVIPDANFGAVILTNSDEGYSLVSPVARRLIELLYDANPTAAKKIAITVEQNNLYQQTQQSEFEYPGDNKVLGNLASQYYNPELGELKVYTEQGDVFIDPGVWRTKIGTKRNADGTHSLVALAPFLLGVEFLVGEADGKRQLHIIYGQDDYTFTEVE